MPDSLSQYVLEQIQNDPDGSYIKSFLHADVLGTAIDALFYARIQIDTSYEQIAERMQQPLRIIKHWEADRDGSIPLGRYVEMAMACGMVPRITLVPFEQAKQEVIQRLEREQQRS